MMQYEYLRFYVNCNLRCPNCLQSYLAVEVPKPGISSRWSSFSRLKRNLDPKSAANHNTTSGLYNNSKWTFSRTSSAAHAASVVQQAYEKVKKEREQAKATARREKKNAKRKSTTDSSASGSLLKKRKVRGENDVSCSGGRKVTYCVTGETGKNMGKVEHGTKERADKFSPRRTQRNISKEDVTREEYSVKSSTGKSTKMQLVLHLVNLHAPDIRRGRSEIHNSICAIRDLDKGQERLSHGSNAQVSPNSSHRRKKETSLLPEV
ncbi:unnamed protein product [Arabidopsis arenosa]|uniref:Zinc beta-ribbon domain-containing protein n=1 Tax=Arabidopsis arenosa TaxID=38785 RepID=A0A8S2B5L4_ARAAE|nr:unnamed protein product [Arabidopsis arenosa]